MLSYILATRPWSMPMTIIAVCVGTLAAFPTNNVIEATTELQAEIHLHLGWFLLTLLAAMLMHTGGNVLNDHFDFKYGVDQNDLPASRLKVHPILSGLISSRGVWIEGIVLIGIAAILGSVIAIFRTPHIWWIGGCGVLGAYFYGGGQILRQRKIGYKLGYKYRALAELCFFFLWGPLMVQGACLVQSEQLSLRAFLISPLVGIWVALVVFANNIRDIENDGHAGIKTLAIILGKMRSVRLFCGLALGSYLYATILIFAGLMSGWGFLVWLSLPMTWNLCRMWSLPQLPVDTDGRTAQVSTIFGALLIVALWL